MHLRVVVPTLLLCCLVAPARAVDLTGSTPPDGLVGLLDVPSLLGSGACTQRSGAHYPLLQAPAAGAAQVGMLEAPPIAAGQTGCSQDALVPRVRKAGDAWSSPVPTREVRVGHPALIVIDQRQGWFQVLVGDTGAWLAQPPASRFYDYDELIIGSPVHPLRGWDHRVCATPRREDCRAMALPKNPALRVGRVQSFGPEVWFRVEFGIGACEGLAKPGRDTLTGWIPGYALPASNGRRPLTLWFDPHGC